MARILVVDDNVAMAEANAGLITRRRPNDEVITAYSPEDALAIIKENPVDLVISDYKMPKMNGVALASAIQAGGPRIPVIMRSNTEAEVIKADPLWQDGLIVAIFDKFARDPFCDAVNGVLGTKLTNNLELPSRSL